MAKVTSKFQVKVPKTIADRYRIRPGDEIAWIPAGDAIRVIPARTQIQAEDPGARVRLFNTERHRSRRGSRNIRQDTEAGQEGISVAVAALVDTNILVSIR